jgi:hypothetical protein
MHKGLSRCLATAVGLILLVSVANGILAQDLVRRALEDSNIDWNSSEAQGVQIFYKPGSFAERHRAMLLRSVRVAIAEVLEFTGDPQYDRTLHVFYVDSRQEMEEIVGQPVSGYSNWTASGIFVVFNPQWRSFEKHETTHVLTMGVWGAPDPSSRWMIEGVSIYADGWCREYSIDVIAYYLLTHDRLPPLEKLFEDFAELGEIRAGVYAASVIGFIRKTYGAEALRNMWTNGSRDLTESLGSPIDQVETSWQEYLRQIVGDDVEIDMESIEELGCG